MQLEQSFDLPFRRELAWAGFQNVSLLISCLPGASLASEPGTDPLEFGFAVKLGPIAANFTGRGNLTYGNDFQGVLSGGGADRGTGSRVKGSATFELREKEGGTQVRLLIDYTLTGSLAQFGRSGIVRELAAGITRQFAANLRENLATRTGEAAADESRANESPTSGHAAPARLDAGALLWNAVKERIRGTRQSDETVAAGGQSGLDALPAVRPQWTSLGRAAKLLALDGRWLLHAGPPLADPLSPPAPLLSSAVLACLYEGWAQTEAQAESLVRSGEVRLEPAQDHRCVTPLAALVTPSTTLIVVEDRDRLAPPAYAPLGATGGPDLRFGTRDPAILERLALRDGEYAETLAAALTEPVDLISIAADAIASGDDLHNRTTAATQILYARLAERYGDGRMRQRVERLLSGLAATPLYFLTFWMAAAKLILTSAEQREPHTLVTRMGANGEVFGISLAGRPDAWITMPATAPEGAYLPGVEPTSQSLGAIGDSAVIDALGFGGQALHLAPEARAALQPFLPPGTDSISSILLAAEHPAFAKTGVRVGLDALRVVKSGVGPVVTLAMVERTGSRGQLGRGVFLPGKELFARAVHALGS